MTLIAEKVNNKMNLGLLIKNSIQLAIHQNEEKKRTTPSTFVRFIHAAIYVFCFNLYFPTRDAFKQSSNL